MWRKSSNSNNEKPLSIDRTTSKEYVYIRRNFKEIDSIDTDGEVIGTHWEYEEAEIPIDNWVILEDVLVNTSDITDLKDALCELSTEVLNG